MKKNLCLIILTTTLFVVMNIAPSPAGVKLDNYNFIYFNLNGSTLYVGGSGPGNFSKIQDAIDNASDGDTVFVYSGSYYENVLINKSIRLIGENKSNTIIEGRKKTDVMK